MAVRSSSQSPREVVDLLTLGFATRYMRRLLADRDHIREAIMNPGGSVIITGVDRFVEGTDEYSSQLGNDYHLDLIQAELEITNRCAQCAHLPQFTDKQRESILDWGRSVAPEEIEKSGLLTLRYGAIRRMRHHTVAKVTKRMTHE